MIYILLSVISSTFVFIIFKYCQKFNVDIFKVIVINYLVAIITGLLINNSLTAIINSNYEKWILLAVIIGILFIFMFYIIGLSTQKAGITVTSISSKMSVVIPVLFSILYYNEEINNLKLLGVLLAIIALVLIIKKKKRKKINKGFIYLPVLLFFGIGLIDSLIKLSQQDYIENGNIVVFAITCFAVSFIVGVGINVINKVPVIKFMNKKVLIFGIILGITNFSTMYFLIYALDSNIFDSSVIFAINNNGIISLSVILALILFKEKISILNWAGIILSLIAIILLSNI
ncbi:MAG: EamA family transporter [Bacteroidales bacterium]|nr:EamA family transporter [Bacteroidales bacterium]